MQRRIIIEVTPKTVSQSRTCVIFPNNFIHISTKVAPEPSMPKTSFTCEVTIIRATAEVKPDETGPLTKSIINPEFEKSLN